MSSYDLQAWAQAIVRWIHVFAAILWIGQTYLFNFFERSLERKGVASHVAGNLWLVHGGGFYFVEKQKQPQLMPQTLHWFKWEAATTWLSGAVLIVLTYYLGGILVDPERSYTMGVAAGVGSLIIGWLVYDLLVRSPLGQHERMFALVGLGLIVGMHAILLQVLTSRAAYTHIGAVLGTIMAANVWMRILPSQRRMIAAVEAGGTPDSALSATGPQRSKHNSYMVIPLVFVMISNHYPTISYGNTYSGLVLAAITIVGWWAAGRFRRG